MTLCPGDRLRRSGQSRVWRCFPGCDGVDPDGAGAFLTSRLPPVVGGEAAADAVAETPATTDEVGRSAETDGSTMLATATVGDVPLTDEASGSADAAGVAWLADDA
jgi:hypothetical protein